jgi:crotonobetainyl-CoA:carnitine CoA-transferase CaiB-like acyl-CoA transferase
MGGTFAAVGILSALREREKTGRGMEVTSALFESTAYLVAQHMAQYEITGEAPPPMSVKRPAWGVYDICETKREFGAEDLLKDERLSTNGRRVKERGWLIPRVNEITRKHTLAELTAKLESIGLPFAPIAKPWDLLDDPHLNASDGLLKTRAGEKTIRVPALPLALNGERLKKRADPPHVGEHGRELLAELGYSSAQIDALARERVVNLG